MYTCADCKRYDECAYERKSTEASAEGDSVAYYCDGFVSKYGRSEVEYKGYHAVQSGVCGYDIGVYNATTHKMVMHLIGTRHETEDDLRNIIEFYIEMNAKNWWLEDEGNSKTDERAESDN